MDNPSDLNQNQDQKVTDQQNQDKPVVNSSAAPPPPQFQATTPEVAQAPTESTPNPVEQTLPPATEDQGASQFPTQSEVAPASISTPVQSSPETTPSPTTVTTGKPEKRSKFKLIIGVVVVIALAVWASVIFLYLQNRQLEESIGDETAEQTPTPTPTPEFSSEQVQILNGSVIRQRSPGEEEILVNKETYESTGITGFARVVVSPNNQKICFESWPPAPEPALYWANVDGSGVSEVSPNRKSCIWSSDSQKIIYENSSSATAGSDIYIYDISTLVETNLTQSSVETGTTRKYKIVSLSADGSKIVCKYENVGTTSEAEVGCEINLETGEVEEL